MVKLLFDFYALSAVSCIMLFSYGISMKPTRIVYSVKKSSELSFYISFSVAIVLMVYKLSDISDLTQFGSNLAFSLLIMLYGSLQRVLVLLFCRVESA